MKINKVNIYKISLPFTGDFSHSRKKGSSANNIIVEVIANQGEIKGYGEGAPRRYVTGESQESAAKTVVNLIQEDSFLWEFNDVSQIWDFIDSVPKGKENNAAICAIEIALLDGLGKSQNKSVLEYFQKDFYISPIYYGATVPLANNQRAMEVCRLVKKMRIKKIRLKMGKGLEQNKEAIKTVRLVFGDDCDLRIDSNGAWDYELALKHVPLLKEHKVKVVEQPMMPTDPDIADFASAMQANGIILMADESACSLRDVEAIIGKGCYKMINVRLSKCGGFRRSIRIIDELRDRGFFFQIGCQLGESGILSAAGRALSLLCHDAVYHDGSYDRFILKENITTEDVSFGRGGEAGPLDGPGLGVIINKESLMRLSNGYPSLSISNPLS
jgi:L-alanine-DL-glutamate epimerase-like enolase superfamily enzyme